MHALKITVRLLCVLAVVTGAIDMFAGVRLLMLGGAGLGAVANDAALNSQIGFWGAIWFGFGIVLWRASYHLFDEVALFRILCGVTALAGLARLGAAMIYGLPGFPLTVAMIVELVAGLGLPAWHLIALRR